MNCGVLGDLLQVANAFGDLRHYEHTECGIVVSHFDVERSNHLSEDFLNQLSADDRREEWERSHPAEDIQHEGYERSEAAPWNRNQSDELEERWRQENEDQPEWDWDAWDEAVRDANGDLDGDDLPDFGDGYEEDFGDDDFLEDDDEEQPYEEDYCDVCGGPCHFGRPNDEDS